MLFSFIWGAFHGSGLEVNIWVMKIIYCLFMLSLISFLGEHIHFSSLFFLIPNYVF